MNLVVKHMSIQRISLDSKMKFWIENEVVWIVK